jgi:uncharacterized tellurite resistance protein B-like protein
VGNSGFRFMTLGLIVLAGAFILRGWFSGDSMAAVYFAAAAAGFALVVYGGILWLRERGKTDEQRQKEKAALWEQVLLSTMARMAYADTNILHVEVETACKVFHECTGRKVDAPTVRVAARGDLTEDKAFRRYLGGVEGRLTRDEKIAVMKGLARVIEADGRVSLGEVGFFDEVAGALKLKPGDLLEIKK